MISNNEIVAKLKAGQLQEHRVQNLELKEAWSQDCGKKLGALANKLTAESKLVVGVSNDGKIVGKNEKWARKTEEIISQHINAHLDPRQACTGIECIEIDEAWIVVVAAKNPGEVVYWGNEAYVAMGSTQTVMAPDEILKLRIQLPGLTDFSRQPVKGEYDVGLATTFTEKVIHRARCNEFSDQDNISEVLKKLGIDGVQVARILFGDCCYRLVKYNRSMEPEENVRRKGLFGLLTDAFMQEIQDWTAQHLKGPEFPYPPRALKEALANAVAHAAFFENDGDIIIELHEEKITISNLCVRESAYFANRWFSRSHKTINGLLMEVLRVAGFVDELGRGKNLIFTESIRGGKTPPDVVLERAGKLDRWKLSLYGGTQDSKLLRLLERSRTIYQDEQKALIAQALVLWREKPVSEIVNYIDGDFSRQFANVLGTLEGPIFYHKEKDKVFLRRWATILLGEGKDSKAFSPAEERSLRDFAYDVQTRFHDGYITPKELRQLGAMGETKSERVLSSNILNKWKKEGALRWIRQGQYQFLPKAPKETVSVQELIDLFMNQVQQPK